MESNFKNLLLLLLTLFFGQLGQAQMSFPNFSEETTMINHMAEVNHEWLKYPELIEGLNHKFVSEDDRIKEHLTLVIKQLRANKPMDLNKSQLLKRTKLLIELYEYAEAKVFPINTNHQNRNPYFIDDYGTYCAVGYLIAQSDNEWLAQRISKEHNFDYIADIKTNGLSDWANDHGFTLDELKWIQPGYPAPTELEPIGNGTNGVVNELLRIGGNNLVFAGNFSVVNDFPCLNIGKYQNDQLDCLGDGLEGIINDIARVSNVNENIGIAGNITNNGNNYPMAIFQDNEWIFIEIPERIGAIGQSLNGAGFVYQNGDFLFYSYMIAISHPSIPGVQEIWRYFQDQGWVKMASVNGIIKDIQYTLGRFVILGSFDSFTNEANGVTIAANNIIIEDISYDSLMENWMTVDYPMNDTILTVLGVGNTMFIGGTCDGMTSENNMCLSRYLNGVVQPVILNQTEDYSSINTMTYLFNDTELILGGNFNFNPFGNGYNGINLARFDLVSSYAEMMAAPNEPVNSITFLGDQLYLGGEFTSNFGTENLNHISRVINPVGISEIDQTNNLILYPNPFLNQITLNSDLLNTQYQIYSISGQLVKQGTADGQIINGLEILENGMYTLNIISDGKTFNKKIIKE